MRYVSKRKQLTKSREWNNFVKVKSFDRALYFNFIDVSLFLFVDFCSGNSKSLESTSILVAIDQHSSDSPGEEETHDNK
jgi:hypothetical protein